MRRFDAILFDMDGTLVDTEGVWFEVSKAVAARFGVIIPEAAGESLHGLDVPTFAERLASDFGLRAEPEEFTAALLENVLKRLPHANARPGVRDLIEGAAASDKKLALVSNSSHQVIEATLSAFDWARLLKRRFSVDEVARGKPQPDLYLHAMASLGVAPERCLVVEDSIAGVTSAVTAGATCVAVSFELDPAVFERLTEKVVPSLQEVAGLLLDD